MMKNRLNILRVIYCIFKIAVFSIASFLGSGISNEHEIIYFYDIFELALTPIIFWEFAVICIIPIAVFSVIDFLIAKKFKFMYFEKFLPFVVLSVLAVIVLLVSKTEWLGFTVAAFILIALQLLISVIELAINRKVKAIAICSVLIIVSVASYSLLLMYQNELREAFIGTPDATGSWGSINQSVERADDWQQLVTDSLFKIKLTDEKSEDDYGYICYSGTYPVIDGSTVCVPLAVEFARQHLGFDDETANGFVNFSTTHEAYVNLMNKTSDQSFFINNEYYKLISSSDNGTDIMLGTQPSEDEIETASELGVTFIKKAICYDAFVFITHKNNPIDTLTVEQIQQIYTGAIKNWKDVGGDYKRIKAYQREPNSGSQTAMEQLVMQGYTMCDPITVPIIVGMGELIDAVAEYENSTSAIGYTYRYYIDTLYKNDNIKVLAIDGIEPTDKNIRDGIYPFSTSYYGVIRAGDEEKTGGKFLDWILSEEGQKCVEQAGYIPVNATK